MSSYTTAILITNDNSPNKVQELNAILEAYETFIFAPLHQPFAAARLWIAEANYMPCSDIVEAINSIEWDRPECVQLFFCSEHDNKFTEAELKPNRMPGYANFVMNNPDGTETWSLERERPPAVAVIEAVKKALGRVEPLLIRFSVASRVSEEAVAAFIDHLASDEKERFNEILGELEEGEKDGAGASEV